MLTPIGEMRDVIAVLTPTTTIDASGGEVTTYAQGDPLYVALRATTTREAVQFGQVNADVSHVIFGHWHDLNGLSANAKLIHWETGEQYELVGMPINDPKRAFTRLNVTRRENG